MTTPAEGIIGLVRELAAMSLRGEFGEPPAQRRRTRAMWRPFPQPAEYAEVVECERP